MDISFLHVTKCSVGLLDWTIVKLPVSCLSSNSISFYVLSSHVKNLRNILSPYPISFFIRKFLWISLQFVLSCQKNRDSKEIAIHPWSLALVSLRRDIRGGSRQHRCILACLKGGKKCPRCDGGVSYARDDGRDQSAGCQRGDGWSELEVFYGLRQVRQLHILYLLRYIHVLHGRDGTRGRCCDSRLHTPYGWKKCGERTCVFQEDSVNTETLAWERRQMTDS